MHDIVFWLQVFTVVPFIIACAGIVQLAHGDKRRQARAALLTVCNPVLIWAVVATAHNEALSVMFAVAGIMLMRKSPFGAGLGIGLAGCAKLSIGIWGLAMLWAYRREPKKAALLCLGTIIPMGLAYVVWQPNAFFQVLRNGSYVSVGSWANPVYLFLDLFLDGLGRQDHRRGDLVRRSGRHRLDAVEGGALDLRAGSAARCRPAARPADRGPAHRR